MPKKFLVAIALAAPCLGSLPGLAKAEVCNLKVLSDASPDYTDMPSMIHSITGKWPTVPEKLYAMFWWNHVARRQVPPMYQHGLEVTDPIRQFNDYGYTQCSTISGINCGIWHNMGFPVKYWDIAGHTVPEVQYDGHWHMYDDSMCNIYFTCDGQRVAGIEDIRQELGCPASGGKVEKYHLVLYHPLSATNTGVTGFATGAEACRSLSDLAGCFRNGGWVWWMNGWDTGHRYILNLKSNEIYTRYYTRLDAPDPKVAAAPNVWKNDPRFFVPNPATPSKDQPDPEAFVGARHIRGTGQWDYQPSLSASDAKDYYSLTNVAIEQPSGLRPERAGRLAEAVFKVQGANVIASQEIDASLVRRSVDDQASIAVSTDAGGHWNTVWTASATGRIPAKLTLIKEVNGAYEVLVRIRMTAKANASDLVLNRLHLRTFTQVNSKTQPRLNIGRNTIYVGAGEQTESTVLWPELQADKYKELIYDAKNIRTEKSHPAYDPVLMPADPKREGYLVYKLQVPGDITRVTIGGRYRTMENNDKGRIAYLVSLDDGKTWKETWRVRGKPNAKRNKGTPVDEIHHQSVDIPRGNKSVLVKYSMFKFGLWNLRAEADYVPGDTTFKPLEVTFTWNERQEDYSLVRRSHTQLLDRLPARYEINVGGADHPEMVSLRINQQGAATFATTQPVEYGYSDGKNGGGQKYVGTWVSYGKNIAFGKKYSFSKPSVQCWAGCNDKDLTRLTDGYIGNPTGGGSYWGKSAGWDDRTPEVGIDLDLGQESRCAAIGLSSCGDDALTGRLARNQAVEVLISGDGKTYRSVGFVNFKVRFKDIPYNYMLGDEESMGGEVFYVPLAKPVTARFVRYKVKFRGGMFFTTELLVHDNVTVRPFDIRIAAA